jgi:Fic family protein
MRKITVGGWRTDTSGPMQVVSGALGREKVHYESPPSDRLNAEMTRFLAWLNAGPATDPVLTSALAHFWFVTIHPFDDGNGRIARAIADMILARSENSAQRSYSMSARIQRERNAYHDILEASQRGDLNITAWLEWYFACLRNAINSSHEILEAVLTKANFWKRHEGEKFNDLQRNLINRLLDGFDGELTSSKWANIAKCSPDTALHDITDLMERNILPRMTLADAALAIT